MTLQRKQFQNLVLLGLIIALFVGCENEFIDLDSDLINSDVATNFNVDSIQYDVVSYTVPLGPVQTNGLPMIVANCAQQYDFILSALVRVNGIHSNLLQFCIMYLS